MVFEIILVDGRAKSALAWVLNLIQVLQNFVTPMRVLQVTFQNPVGTHVFLRSYNLLTPRFVFDLAKLGLVLAYLGRIGLTRVT